MNDLHTTLTRLGMEPSVADIYIALMELGESQVPSLAKKTGLSRAAVYPALSYLFAEGYVEYRKEGRNAFYKPVHPEKLRDLLAQKKREVALLEGEMNETIRSLTGIYNLSFHKPGVRFFEGREGLKEALYDTLTTTDRIDAYINFEDIMLYAAEINAEYVIERQEKNIPKRLLLPDTPQNRSYIEKQNGQFTDIRFLPPSIQAFKSNLQIYGNKISHFTLRKDEMIAIIIEDPDITELHRNIFSFLWGLSTPIITQQAT